MYQLLKNGEELFNSIDSIENLDIIFSNITFMQNNKPDTINSLLEVTAGNEKLSYDEVSDYLIGYPPQNPLDCNIFTLDGIEYYSFNQIHNELTKLIHNNVFAVN